MKRYMQLIRAILEYVTVKSNGNDLALPEINGYTPDQVSYHVKLCEEAGFLDIVIDASTKQATGIVRITWQGHEFLDN